MSTPELADEKRFAWGLFAGSPFLPGLRLIAPDIHGIGGTDFKPHAIENWPEKKRVTIRVTMPSLVFAKASRGANIMADAMSGNDPELTAASGSLLQINAIEGGSISLDVSNGGDIKISGGTCTSLSANVSGGASLDMEKVLCAKVKIDVGSGSQVSVHADESVSTDASSGSRIRVHGVHEVEKISVSSGGKAILQ